MKFAMLIFAMAGVLIFAAGCQQTVTEIDTGKEFTTISVDEETAMEAAGKQYGEEMLLALQTADFELLIKNLMPDFRKQVTEADFKKSCEEYRKNSGEQGPATYMGSTRNGPMARVYIWKVEYTKTATMKDGEQSVVYDKLFMIPVAKADGEYRVLGFRFI